MDLEDLPTSPRSQISSTPPRSIEDSSKINLGNSSSPPVQKSREQFQLEKVSNFTGLHPNYILYELSLNPSYTLPLADVQNRIRQLENFDFLSSLPTVKPEDINTLFRGNPISAAGLLREQMLRVMGDKLVGAMSLSLITDYIEVVAVSNILISVAC